MIIVGLDLSFTRTGVTVLDTEKSSFGCYRESVEIKDKSFLGTLNAVEDLIGRVLVLPEMFQAEHFAVEEPFPGGEYSSGLFALDSLMIHELRERGKSVSTYNPTTLKHLIGHRSPKKSESVELMQNVAIALELYDFTGHRICHDEAESFLYAVLASADLKAWPKDKLDVLKGVNPRFLEGGRRHVASPRE